MREEWTYKKLGEVCEIFGRIGFRGYTREDYVNTIKEGAISLSPSNIINNQLDFSNCTYITWDKYNQSPEIKIVEGDVLFVKTASVGKCAYVSALPHESTINPQFVVFKNISIYNRFLFYQLLSSSFQYKVKRITSGTSVPTITQKDLSELGICYPNIEEQQRIVSELDLLSSIIEKKKAQLKEYDQLAQSIFYDMFGDPVENPKGWEVKLFGDVYKLKSGDGLSAKDFIIGDYPVYGGNGISGYHNAYNMNGIYIIIGRVGAYCGNVRYVEGRFWLTDNAFQLFFDNKLQHPVFTTYMLRYLDLHKYANHAAQPVISNITLKDIKVLYPPLPLQQSFASKIEAIEHQKALVQQSITETETLFNSRMDYYFD